MLSPEFPRRVLVTGAGGPAAIGFLRLAHRPDVEFFAADIDPFAAGLYLVPPQRRLLVPAGDDPDFVESVRDLCVEHRITIVVPTAEAELIPLARGRARLAGDGITLINAPMDALEVCLDKAQLTVECHAMRCNTPHTQLLRQETLIPIGSVVKPRFGSGSRGVRRIMSEDDLVGIPRDGSHIVQEFLPGEELSVDVFVRADGALVAAVPRTRDRIDSGAAVAGRTVADPDAIAIAAGVVSAAGVRGIANVKLRRRSDGTPVLLEVNPRSPGGLVMTAAAGPNLAALALAEAMGEAIPDKIPFRQVAVVRYLTEKVVDVDHYAVIRPEAVAV